MAEEKPIIVIKKKGGHGGHHGGAWKVAYADFVTAMMCFFMVMWLINSADSPTRKNIAAYFKRPGIFESGSGSPLMTGSSGIMPEGYPPEMKRSKKFASGEARTQNTKKSGPTDLDLQGKGAGAETEATSIATPSSEAPANITPAAGGAFSTGGPDSEGEETPQALMEKMAEQIKRQIAVSPELQELLGKVDIKIDADGLNVEIMDSDKFSMFRSGSARILPDAEPAFAKIAAILNKVPNTIDIVGHTDNKPFSNSTTGYTNWELSTDRANAARRLLERSGIPPDRITNVQGRADRELKTPEDPTGPSNRRISLKVRFPVSATVNAGEDPGALERIMNEPTPQAAEPTAAPPPIAGQPRSQPTPRAPTRTLSPQEILDNQKKQAKKPVQLPKSPPPSENPEYMEPDKIFPEIPVLGPPSPFSSF